MKKVVDNKNSKPKKTAKKKVVAKNKPAKKSAGINIPAVTNPELVDMRQIRVEEGDKLPAGFVIHTDGLNIRRMLKIPILDLYIFKEILNPFLVALSFFTMIYMIVALQKIIGLFLSKGIELSRLIDYLGYVLGNTFPMTIPMACLMSGIMAAGRLSGDSEITAMRSAGIAFPRIYRIFLVFGFLMSLLVGYMNFYLSPENTKKMKEFNNWIVAYNPLLAVNPGQFSGDKTQEMFSDKARTLYTEGMNNKTGEMTGIQIREWQIEMDPKNTQYYNTGKTMLPIGTSRIIQIISAKRGNLIEKMNTKGEYEKAIRLKEGFVVEWNPDKKGFSITNFINSEMDYNVPKEKKEQKKLEINVKPDTFSMPVLITIRDNIESEGLENIPGLEILKELGISVKGIGGLKEMVNKLKMDIISGSTNKTMSSDELTQKYAILTQLMGLLEQSEKVLTQFNIEIHKRIAMPISCQIFFFLSFPLGLVVKRSGKGMSFTLAVVFLLVYYAFFLLGSNISYKKSVPDWIGPWSANIVISIISLYIMVTRTDIKLPGWLEKIIIFIQPVKEILDKLRSKVIEILKNLFKNKRQ